MNARIEITAVEIADGKVVAIEFDSELVSETSYSRSDLGMHKNRMRLHADSCPHIEWSYGIKSVDEDELLIGLELDGMKVDGYDGVFSLPKQAQALLAMAGYDITEVED